MPGDNSIMTHPLLAEPPPSRYCRPVASEFVHRGARVALISAVMALLMTYVMGRFEATHVWRALVYSESIALLSWLLIDGGRFVVGADPDSGWPTGWRGLALPVVGTALGFAGGTALADLLSGHVIYGGYSSGQRSLKADLLISAAIGAGFSGFYYLRGQTAHQQARLLRAERDLTLARLAMLQSQLEPHMLFNTLANLRVLIGMDPPRAQAMLDRMIAYLRATLDGSRKPLHPLSAEFERLADYLALMAVRMGPRLQVALDLPAELRAAPVPPMLLQPLVENSIKHGLEPKVAGGRIEVSARRMGEQLELCVRDTGVGLGAVTEEGAQGASHFGVAQVRERLSTLFGAQSSLTLLDVADERGGVLARLLLPLATSPSSSPLTPPSTSPSPSP